MQKETFKNLKEKLEKTKKALESTLGSFSEKDRKLSGDWNTRFPDWNGETGGAALEQAADKVEEYSTLLPIEHSLELRLRDVNSALKKIKKRTYGICERCKKPIGIRRLNIVPEARSCRKCLENKK